MSKTDEIARGRAQVDEIDAKIVELLGERFKITRRIGAYKAAHGIVKRDPGRESAQLAAIAKRAGACGVNPELAQQLLRLTIEHVVKEHQEMQAEQNT